MPKHGRNNILGMSTLGAALLLSNIHQRSIADDLLNSRRDMNFLPRALSAAYNMAGRAPMFVNALLTANGTPASNSCDRVSTRGSKPP